MPPAATLDSLPPAARSTHSDTKPAARGARRQRALLLAAALSLGLTGGGYWYATRAIESTDNAQIDADVVAVPARVGGTVARVYFSENQSVAAGALLAELDAADRTAKLAQAEAGLLAAHAAADAADADAELAETQALGNRAMARANLSASSADARASGDEIREGEAQVETAQARLRQAELDFTRAQELFSSGAYARTQRDQAQTAYDVARTALSAESARLASLRLAETQSQGRVREASAKLGISDNVATLLRQAKARAANAHAQVETARAARKLATLELSYTRIVAPRAGVVSKKGINVGQAVAPGQTVVQLVPEERWVTANFKETQLAHMRPGQHARIQVDAYPDLELEGEVQSFSAATGARFTLLPPDNASGNFTKVVQRVPVRIRVRALPRGLRLQPGMSVQLDVDTGRG